jgi:hypothetical protein
MAYDSLLPLPPPVARGACPSMSSPASPSPLGIQHCHLDKCLHGGWLSKSVSSN